MCSAIEGIFKQLRVLGVLAVLAGCLFLLSGVARADVIVLHQGNEITGTVKEYSNGSFIFVVGQEVHSLPAEQVKRVIFAAIEPAPEAVLADPRPTETELPAPPPAPPLEITSSTSSFDRGVLIVSGEVRNNTDATITFVRLLFTLHDVNDTVLAQNCMYVPGPEPHLLAGETRAFRCAFVAPPANTYKYRVSVESLSLTATDQ